MNTYVSGDMFHVNWILVEDLAPPTDRCVFAWKKRKTTGLPFCIARYMGDGIFAGPEGPLSSIHDVSHWANFRINEPNTKESDHG